LTGLAFLSRSKECSAASLGTPGMSEGFHAKMSQLSRRKEVSALSYVGSRLAHDYGGLVRFIVPEDDGLGCYDWSELRLGSRLLGEDLLLICREVLCCPGNKNYVPG
jgi:hypothetical protein